MKTLEKTRAKNDWDTRKLEKRLKTLAKSQFRSESSPRKSRLLEKTRANWASQRSTKPNYAKSSRHSSENCRVHKKTREIPKSKRNQKRTDGHAGQIDTAKATVLCCVCVRACVHASKQGKTISRLWVTPPTSDLGQIRIYTTSKLPGKAWGAQK